MDNIPLLKPEKWTKIQYNCTTSRKSSCSPCGLFSTKFLKSLKSSRVCLCSTFPAHWKPPEEHVNYLSIVRKIILLLCTIFIQGHHIFHFPFFSLLHDNHTQTIIQLFSLHIFIDTGPTLERLELLRVLTVFLPPGKVRYTVYSTLYISEGFLWRTLHYVFPILLPCALSTW